MADIIDIQKHLKQIQQNNQKSQLSGIISRIQWENNFPNFDQLTDEEIETLLAYLKTQL